MTSKKELINFTYSFPGADAQISGRMTNNYVIGDTIEYKTITVQDSSSLHKDVNITNRNSIVNISGSLNLAGNIICKNAMVEDINCRSANINYLFVSNMDTKGIVCDEVVTKNLIVNELVKTKVLVADDISATGILCNVIRATGIECEAILMGKNEISYTDNNLNISGSLNLAHDVTCRTAHVNNVSALDIKAGVINTDILVSKELVKTKVLLADDISATGILCYEISATDVFCYLIAATGVECEAILMGTNQITYSDSNLNFSNNLQVNGDLCVDKKLSSNTLFVDTSILSNSISTTMSATFGKNLYVGGEANIKNSVNCGGNLYVEYDAHIQNSVKCVKLTSDLLTVNDVIKTPSISIGNTTIYANSFNLEIKETIDYYKTVIVTSRTDGTLTYGDRILFVGINGFRGTLEITEIKPDNLYLGTMHNIITTMESVITSYGMVEISPLITNGKLTDFSIIGANNVITGGTNLYLGINGVMGLGSWTDPGTFTMYISGFATTNLTPPSQ
jgi:hypothetical protein